ncbi:MAG: BatA domain-containing protein [Rubripirellula sp.]
MSFLNATLVFGTLAAIIPIVLHLIARREPRKVVFPSIAFLTKRLETNRSKLKVRRWWLLAMRIAAIAALAVALARPAIHQSMSLTWLTIALVVALGVALLAMASVAIANGQSKNVSMGLAGGAMAAIVAAGIWGVYTYASGPAVSTASNEPLAFAVVMDNSPTSAWRDADGQRIERMRGIAVDVASRLPPTSRIAVIDRSMAPAAFSMDIGGAVSQIEQVEPRQVVGPLASRIDAAARLLRTSDLESRQILVITDLSNATWDQSLSESGLIEVLGQDSPIGLSIFDLGQMKGSNRALSIPHLADATPASGVTTPISTTLTHSVYGASTNPGTDPSDGADQSNSASKSRSIAVDLEMFESDPSLPVIRNGVVVYPAVRSVDRTSATIAPGGSSDLLMTIPSLPIGTHHGRIRLSGNDAMPLDDIRYFTISVLPPSRVLIISDDVDEAEAIGRVIASENSDKFQIERIGSPDLDAADLSEYDVVTVLDPIASVLTSDSIIDYARGGGGVLVALGPNAGNEATSSALAGNLIRRWRVPNPGTFMQITGASSTVTDVVATDTPWNDFRIRQYWQVELSPSDQTLIQYSGTDHPALFERTIQPDDSTATKTKGRILVMTTPIPALVKATRSWNDLFGSDPWPAWLLVRQCVEHLSNRSDSSATGLVGHPTTIRWHESGTTQTTANDTATGAAGDSTRLQLFPPDGALPIPIEVSPLASQIVVSESSRAGTYWLRGAEVGLGFSANLPTETITDGRIDESSLDTIFGPGGYNIATQQEEVELSGNAANARVSLQSPAMLLALIVFLLEQILGNRFYRHRT